MKIILTKQAKKDLKTINKLVEFLETPEYYSDIAPDFNPYDTLTSYDMLVADMGMYVNEAYAKNKFDSVEQFAKEVTEGEGIKITKIMEKINKAILLEIITIE